MAKTFSISILAELIDKFSKPFDAIGKKLQGVSKKWEDVGKKMNKDFTLPITVAAGLSIAALKGSEAAEAKMRAALAATGTQAVVNLENIKKYAEQLQDLTRIEDDVSVAGLAALQGFAALNEQGLKAALPAMQDMSEALDKDLVTMGEMWGKTLATDTNMLSRYGIQVEKTWSTEKKLSSIIEQVNKRWKGTAEALGATGTGGLTKLYNKLGNLAEAFGANILQVLDPFIQFSDKLINMMLGLDDSTRNLIVTIGLLVAAIGPLISAGGKLMSVLGTAFTNPVMLAVGALALLVAGIVGVNEAMKKHENRNIIAADAARDEAEQTEKLVAEYNLLKSKTSLNTEEKKKLLDIEMKLKAILPESTLLLDEQARVIGLNTEALKEHMKELNRVEKENIAKEIDKLKGEIKKDEDFIKVQTNSMSRKRAEIEKIDKQGYWVEGGRQVAGQFAAKARQEEIKKEDQAAYERRKQMMDRIQKLSELQERYDELAADGTKKVNKEIKSQNDLLGKNLDFWQQLAAIQAKFRQSGGYAVIRGSSRSVSSILNNVGVPNKAVAEVTVKVEAAEGTTAKISKMNKKSGDIGINIITDSYLGYHTPAGAY